MELFRSQTIEVDRDADGTVFLKIDVPGRSVNVLTRQVMADLQAALDRLAGEPTVPLLVVRTGKPSGFLAGADLSEFLDIEDSAGAEAMSARGQALFDRLAGLPMPSIAMIHGPCLGGGLELALACDYRLAFDRPGTQLGLPEVELGLLPAWGGTQRLPRVVGMERALQIILGGRRLGAADAFRWGLADALATSESQLRQQFSALQAQAIRQGKRPRKGLPLRGWRQKLLESTPVGRRLILRGAQRVLARRVPEDMPAPAEALEAVRVGVAEGMEQGLAQERRAAGRLATSTACRNLIGLFFAREKARKLPAAWEQLPLPPVRRVGVVGGGVMGAGIAQLAALKGCEVIVQEVNETALGAGLLRIQQLFEKAIERGILPPLEAQQRLAQVRGTVTWEGFDRADLAIEAAVESLDAKRAIFRELDARTPPETPLATNTSSLAVTALQEGLSHPGRVAGLHFFNPVHKMPLVEVIGTPSTCERALALLTRWSIDLGKTPVQVKDSPGFVVNRILMPYLNEAVLLVREGLPVQQIDHGMKRFGMPMGPLELLDQVGLDVAAHVARSMEPVMKDRFPPSDAFEQMRASGWLGHKSERGFYIHRAKRPTVNVLAENLLRTGHEAPAVSKALPMSARLAEARERLVLLMVNEAVLLLGEQVAEDAQAIDLAMVMGTGWAPHRGGPLHYADARGLGKVVEALEELASRHGPRFRPAAELVRRASEGRPLVE